MIFNHLSKLDLKDNWFNGRLYHLSHSTNISKMLKLLTSKLNYIVAYMNRIYPSVYPCLGVELLKEHAIELGLPDSIFRNDITYYRFPYTFPLPFKNGLSNLIFTDLSILRRDIIVKKYLMHDNSIRGYKRIGATYGVCIDIEEVQTEIITGVPLGTASNGATLTKIRFPYKLPLYFGKGIKSEWADRWTQKNPLDKAVISKIKIKIYQTDDLTYLKLKEIFKWMQPLTIEIEFERLTTPSTCNLSILQICDYLK